jgi:hypothetical protein
MTALKKRPRMITTSIWSRQPDAWQRESAGAPAKAVLAAAQWDMRHDPPQLEC